MHTQFAPTLTSVRAARSWLDESCADQSAWPAVRKVVELLLSEVVANAVLHGQGEITVEVSCTANGVEVTVSDHGPGRPSVRQVPASATGGRGMALVDALASRWGVTSHPGGAGKTVWFSVEAGVGS